MENYIIRFPYKGNMLIGSIQSFPMYFRSWDRRRDVLISLSLQGLSRNIWFYTREPAWFCAGTIMGTPPMREMLAVVTVVGSMGGRGI